jgi:hypothetical protein
MKIIVGESIACTSAGDLTEQMDPDDLIHLPPETSLHLPMPHQSFGTILMPASF